MFVYLFREIRYTDKWINIQFLFLFREIPVFKTFPIDVLKKEPGMCLLNYFKLVLS